MLAHVERALRRPRYRLVAATLRGKQSLYAAELSTAPSLSTLRDLAAREQIIVRYAALGDWIGGMALREFGRGCVLINRALPRELRRRICAHELAHLWLRHDHQLLRAWRTEEAHRLGTEIPTGSPLYQRTEDEADLLASALLGLSVPAFRAPLYRYYERVEQRQRVEDSRAA